MFCRKCGAEIQNDSDFCSNCGAKVIDDRKDTPIKSSELHKSVDDINNTAIDEAEVLSEAGVKRANPGRYWLGGLLILTGIFPCIGYPVSHIRYGTGIPIKDIFICLVISIIGIVLIYNARRYTRDNKTDYDEAIANHKDPMPYVEVRKIALRHQTTGLIKKCNTGYCWGMFLFTQTSHT